jgi:hypothetical protein
MKNTFALFLVVFLASCTCEDDSPTANACTSNDPVNEIPWVSALKNSIDNCTCTTSVMKGTYQSQNVFFVLMNDPLCNGGGSMVLYNCAGDVLTTIDVSDFTDLVKIDSILYSCEE